MRDLVENLHSHPLEMAGVLCSFNPLFLINLKSSPVADNRVYRAQADKI